LADGWAPCTLPVSFGRLSQERARCQPPGTAALLCLVKDAVDRPERRCARRQSVCPAVQGWPEPSATGRMPANVQTASHGVIEKFQENARRAAMLGNLGRQSGCRYSARTAVLLAEDALGCGALRCAERDDRLARIGVISPRIFRPRLICAACMPSSAPVPAPSSPGGWARRVAHRPPARPGKIPVKDPVCTGI
jgi:hypothetical protein